MKERPILFNAEMVNAILEGRKNQTRRVINPQPTFSNKTGFNWEKRGKTWMYGLGSDYAETVRNFTRNCPVGRVGDRLWVREAFTDLSGTGIEHRDSKGKLQRYAYAADCPKGSYGDEARKEFGIKWKPSIHMPRAASRITLEITKIRVERLNDISQEDAIAEGVPCIELGVIGELCVAQFADIWESVYGADSWDANPWVWVIEFEVVKGDAL